MTSLQLKFRGDPVLESKSIPVEDIDNDDFQDFIDDLIEACYEYDGVGIAAPQVGHNIAVFIMMRVDESDTAEDPEYFPEAVINPEILSHSNEVETDWEGCLSVPDMRGEVTRFFSIEVRYTTRHGELISTRLNGFPARVFQHEFDHLQGILYPDRMEDSAELITLDELEKRLDRDSEIF